MNGDSTWWRDRFLKLAADLLQVKEPAMDGSRDKVDLFLKRGIGNILSNLVLSHYCFGRSAELLETGFPP